MSRLVEFKNVIDSVKSAWERNVQPALVMLIGVNGSAYRLPGTKMMMAENGDMYGSISGGCLESDIFGWAEQAMQQKTPLVKNYDLSENEIWSLGIGCKGSLEIFILPVQENDSFWKLTDELLNEGEGFSIILEVPTGIKTLMNKDGYVLGDKEGLPRGVYERIMDVMKKQRRAEVMEWQGRRYVLDVIKPSERLIVAGAGKDAIPVADFAAKAGFSVTILDPRSEFNNERFFPNATHLVLDAEDLESTKLEDTWWVIMNHLQKRDEAVLKLALQSKPKYIGVLGPVSRTEEMIENIGVEPSTIDSLYSPVGLDIGAETMDEVAMSIVSELIMVRSQRSGQSLKGKLKIHV